MQVLDRLPIVAYGPVHFFMGHGYHEECIRYGAGCVIEQVMEK